MADNAYDVQICLWKMLKLSSKTCVDASINHPYVSSSLFFSFLLYVFFPLVFWILVYSTPLVVCSFIAITTLRKPTQDAEANAKSDQNYNSRKKAKFATERVHSVRRRRAKEIMMENEPAKQNTILEHDEFTLLQQDEFMSKQNILLQQDEQNILLQQDEKEDEKEEKKVISSTNYDDCVDKSPLLVQEIPKEIREVEQVHSPSLKHENKNEEQATNEDDHKNNVMDIGISDTERTKRLESLIARRRSRKMLNHQVRSSLMNMDKNNNRTTSPQMASLIIPKNITYGPNKISGPFSPGPGSAPSVLIPMRNPFDLPYDPQEEKPDLTGDSFHQEFTSSNNYRDMMFSRHESFSLGPSSTGEHFRNRDTTSSGRDFLFRRAGYSFSRLENEFSGRKFAPIMEQVESKSSINSPDDDQIKEIIQLDENESENHSEDESETRQIPQSDFNTSSSSPSSSEEDQPLYKIDREAVLKSLSSMRRNALLEIENNEDAMGNNLSYANSALENATRLKQQYYDDNKSMRHHAISYSIASDMQVEVSEVSSPPLTIDENMINGLSWDGDDLINDSLSRIETTEDDSLSDTTDHNEVHCVQSDQGNNIEPEQRVQDEHTSGDQIDQQLHSSTISPKSVLIPTLSLSNLDQEEAHQSAPHTSTPGNASPQSVNDELKNQETIDQSQQFVINDDEASSRSIDATSANDSNQNSFNKNIDKSEDEMVIRESTHEDERQINSTSSNSFDETKQVQDYYLSKLTGGNETNEADRDDEHQSTPHNAESLSPANASPESVNDELKNQENIDQSKDQVANSSTGRDEETSSRSNDSEATSNQNAFRKSIDQPEDQMEIRESTQDDVRTNSTSSNSFDGTKQIQDYDLSESVEGKETNRANGEDEQYTNLQGTVLPETINSIENDNK